MSEEPHVPMLSTLKVSLQLHDALFIMTFLFSRSSQGPDWTRRQRCNINIVACHQYKASHVPMLFITASCCIMLSSWRHEEARKQRQNLNRVARHLSEVPHVSMLTLQKKTRKTVDLCSPSDDVPSFYFSGTFKIKAYIFQLFSTLVAPYTPLRQRN